MVSIVELGTQQNTEPRLDKRKTRRPAATFFSLLLSAVATGHLLLALFSGTIVAVSMGGVGLAHGKVSARRLFGANELVGNGFFGQIDAVHVVPDLAGLAFDHEASVEGFSAAASYAVVAIVVWINLKLDTLTLLDLMLDPGNRIRVIGHPIIGITRAIMPFLLLNRTSSTAGCSTLLFRAHTTLNVHWRTFPLSSTRLLTPNHRFTRILLFRNWSYCRDLFGIRLSGG